MADFCHEFDPGGLGCPHPGPCPDGCTGDFFDWKSGLPSIRDGYFCNIGICEGHGSVVRVENVGGELYLKHDGATDIPLGDAS